MLTFNSATHKAWTPSKMGPTTRKKRKKPTGVDVLRTRQRNGQDLFTGEQLTGLNAKQWLRTKAGVGEEEPWALSVESIIHVSSDRKTVIVGLQGGQRRKLFFGKDAEGNKVVSIIANGLAIAA